MISKTAIWVTLALAVSLVSYIIYTLSKAVLILILDIWSCNPPKAF